MNNKTLTVGCDLNGRKLACAIPDTTVISELKYIAKVNDDNYIAEDLRAVEGQTGDCSVGFYHYNDADYIFYLRNSNSVVTNLTSINLPDDFGVVTEINKDSTLYDYITRNCHEKVYVLCEDFCKEEAMTKSEVNTKIEEEVGSHGVPTNGIMNFDGDTVPGGYEEVEDINFKNLTVDTIKSKNEFNINTTYDKIGSSTTYSIVGSKITVTGKWFIGCLINVEPNTDYYLSFSRLSNVGMIRIMDEAETTSLGYLATSFGFNSGNNTKIRMYIYANPAGTDSQTAIFENIQLEEGTVATDYTDYIDFENNFKKISYQRNLSQKKWYRIARINGPQGGIGNSFILNVNTTFGTVTNKAFVLGISIAYNKANIVTLSCTENASNNVVSVVKVTKDANGFCYLEIFYNLETANSVNFEIISNKSNIIPLNFEDVASGEILIKSHNIRNPYDITTGQETATNEYIDGKQVYLKIINCGALPNATQKTVAHGLSNFEMVDIRAVFSGTSGDKIYVPHINLNNLSSSVGMSVNNTNIYLNTGINYSGYTGYVTIYYTKN